MRAGKKKLVEHAIYEKYLAGKLVGMDLEKVIQIAHDFVTRVDESIGECRIVLDKMGDLYKDLIFPKAEEATRQPSLGTSRSRLEGEEEEEEDKLEEVPVFVPVAL